MTTATQNKVIEVNESNFQRDVLDRSEDLTVVVDFWAPWCGPCRMLGPTLERLAGEEGSSFILAKINVDHNPGIANSYGVRGIPAVKAFRDGQVIDEFVGALPEPNVKQFIAKVAPSSSDKPLSQAHELLRGHQWTEATIAYRQLLHDQPEIPELRVGLAQALLAQGEGCEAQTLLEDIPAGPAFARADRLMPLAHYLCRAERDAGQQELTLLETKYRQAGVWLKRGNLSRAMDTLLAVLQENKAYHKGEARMLMLALFEILGPDDPLIPEYRTRLATILY